MPSLSSPPSGCRFHTRCHRFLGDICANQEPPEQQAGEGHIYACHIPPDELLKLQTEGSTTSGEATALVEAQIQAADAAMAEGAAALAKEQHEI